MIILWKQNKKKQKTEIDLQVVHHAIVEELEDNVIRPLLGSTKEEKKEPKKLQHGHIIQEC